MTQTRQTQNRTMLTDLYQLTMNAGYFDSKKGNDKATFDLFIRKLPQDWGFFIANGIEDAVDYATSIRFENDDIEFLRSQGMFSEEYLASLKDFGFTGEIRAVREGTPVAANTPILSVTAPRAEAQLLETMLLNTINFQTMIATKANRVVNAAAPAKVVDFGLRRAQEMDAAMKGARAAYIGGAVATSNVLAGKELGIPVSGTQAHSFVMSFPNELESFRAYARTFPNNPTLLIDTYDTLNGARNAAIIGKELGAKGKRLGAVRLDSGDLAELSRGVRKILDDAGLRYVKILASNDLNEYKIAALMGSEAPIDGFGVGTEMITAKPVAAIPGVYKLVEDEDGGKIKLSSGKVSYPGRKQVYRVTGGDGNYIEDMIALDGEKVAGRPLLEKMVENGERVVPRREIGEIRKYCLEEVAKMPEDSRNVRATQYTSSASPGLVQLVSNLSAKYSGGSQ
jgi:nicotinate phosphoribosyltransferase